MSTSTLKRQSSQLEESVRLAPNSFIAQLKLGELWMRLRAMDKAEEHTRLAGLLAQSLAQSELARRQAATIRTMRREGIERGGYKSPWSCDHASTAPPVDPEPKRAFRRVGHQLNHATSPSACAAAGYPTAGMQDCRLAV